MRPDLIFHDMEQGTPEWMGLHIGRITGSTSAGLLSDGITEEGKKKAANIRRAITNLKNRKEKDHDAISKKESELDVVLRKHWDFGAATWTLIYQLASGIVTGQSGMDWSGNYWTERGKELEAEAVEAYMEATFQQVNRVGFIEWGKYAGCSPDFMVDDKRGGEVKCLSAREHFRYAHTRQIEKDYYAQIQWCLFVTGFEVWDYVHYCPNAGAWTLIIDEVRPDKEMHERFAEKLEKVAEKVKQIVEIAIAPALV